MNNKLFYIETDPAKILSFYFIPDIPEKDMLKEGMDMETYSKLVYQNVPMTAFYKEEVVRNSWFVNITIFMPLKEADNKWMVYDIDILNVLDNTIECPSDVREAIRSLLPLYEPDDKMATYWIGQVE